MARKDDREEGRWSKVKNASMERIKRARVGQREWGNVKCSQNYIAS
jgi:hypothetical protein